jgi:hypothetical protein
MPVLFYNRRMSHYSQRRRLHSLIVSMAILLNLFAPAIGHALTSLTRDPLALELCTATPADTQAPSKQAAHGAKHCVFCATHADSYAPPPLAAGLQAVLHGHDDYPALHRAPPAARLVWSNAQPRAPPALS